MLSLTLPVCDTLMNQDIVLLFPTFKELIDRLFCPVFL